VDCEAASLMSSDLGADSSSDLDALQRELGAFNHVRLAPAHECGDWEALLAREHLLKHAEGRFVEQERLAVRELAASAPRDAGGFMNWFEALKATGPGQNDALFPWLAEHASLAQMRWFLKQEMAGEAGFDDLVALTQVRLPVRAKLELARNYWDELGQGKASAMHGPMLARLGEELAIENDGRAVWESLALANLMVALAANRRYGYQSLGALGVIEMTAPGRSERVNAGLKRLGVGGAARQYFALHASLDIKHSAAWNREVLRPIVASNPEFALPIAEGALMRLNAGARCFARYRQEFGIPSA
jgi:hypothetical protein